MSAETNLDCLLQTMQPVLQPEEYVFCTLPSDTPVPTNLEPVGTFSESEGLTLIVTAAQATAAGLDGIYPCRMITLNVHSSLEAVGFLARITTHLAAHGLSVNPVSGYFHDHLFVPTERAAEAMRLLLELKQ